MSSADTRFREVSFNESGDLVWYGHDLGPAVSSLMPGANEYEFWRTIRAPHVAKLAAAMGVSPAGLPHLIETRFASDVDLEAFAKAHDVPTDFQNWIPTNWDDQPTSLPPPTATEETALSEMFAKALMAAAVMHRDQVRKGTSVPYVSHLLGTCAIALEYGANEDQAIAALLHDAIEDVEPTDEARAIVASFGSEVLRIVEACSDSDVHPRPPWRGRKEAYIRRLAAEDGAALLVSASDKLHNARTIVGDLHRHGPALWERFNPDSDQLWYYRSLVTAFRLNPEHNEALIKELDRTVTEMERLGGAAGR